MNGLWGYSIGSTIKAIKLLSGLEKHGCTVSFQWLRDGVKEPDSASPQTTVKTGWLKSIARILLFTPKEMLHNFLDYRRELRLVEQERPEVIITRLDAFRISSWFVAKRKKIPFVIEADGANSYEWMHYNGGPHVWNWVVLACEKFLLQKADQVFTQTNVAQAYFIRTHNLSKEKFTVITNGADPVELISQEKRDMLKAELGIAPNQVVIGFLGSMHHWHGIGDLHGLIANTFAAHQDAVFLFIGSGGSQADALTSQFSNTERQRLIFSGAVDNSIVHEYVQLFDVALAPYPKIELFYFSPVKIFEYMAAGKAIVAPALGQIDEVLTHDESAVLYTPGDFTDLQNQLFSVLQSPGKRKVLGTNAHKQFVHYSWQQKSDELFDALTSLKNR